MPPATQHAPRPANADLTHLDRFQDVISRISYKDWRFRIVQVGPHNYFLQIEFDAADNDVPAIVETQKGRKWWLSEHMTDSESAQTCLKAVLAAEEHEAREAFMVEGVAVFGPHFDVFALAIMDRGGMMPRATRRPRG